MTWEERWHPLREEVERGRLVRWWIEGAQINWELGIARLSGGYESPIVQTFIRLARKYIANDSEEKPIKKVKPAAKPKTRTKAKR